MIQEKDFLYRVPVKTAPITTPRGQIRNPEILVDLEGGEFMHGNILDANSTNKLVNQSVKEAVDNKIIEGGYVTKDLLEAETTRATEALNKQVDTLNAAISAKQDAGSYIPYDQTITSRYKIDKDLMVDNSKGSAVLGTAIISAFSNSNTEIQINPSSITMRDEDDVVRLARNGVTLPGGDNDHVLTSYGSTLNIGEYATKSDLGAQISSKADRSDLLTLEQRITANTTAIEDKQDAGYYVTYIKDDGTKYTLQKGLELGNGENTVTINEGGMDIRILENRIALGTGIIGSNGDDSYSIDCDCIRLNNMGCEITISPIEISSVTDEHTTLFNIGSTAIILGPTNNPNVKISEEGIKFKGKTNSYIPTADGDFIELSSLASAEDISSLRVGLSKKQNKITVNTVDITDIETADVTKLRTIVTSLINALSSSGLINTTYGVE